MSVTNLSVISDIKKFCYKFVGILILRFSCHLSFKIYINSYSSGTQSLDQTGRASLGSYYESVASSVSSKDSGVQNGGAGGGYHPVISRQESHPMITNTSPGPALVAQALSGIHSNQFSLPQTDYKIIK